MIINKSSEILPKELAIRNSVYSCTFFKKSVVMGLVSTTFFTCYCAKNFFFTGESVSYHPMTFF